MELILLMGIQATGKSNFCRERFFRTHVRLNLDMLRTRRRENLLVEFCLKSKTKFVVDNTNLTSEVRARFIAPAKAAGFQVIGYFFEERPMHELADELGVSESRISQMRAEALSLLKTTPH